jgi:hypothetical protein
VIQLLQVPWQVIVPEKSCKFLQSWNDMKILLPGSDRIVRCFKYYSAQFQALLCIYLPRVNYDLNYRLTAPSTGLWSKINNFSKPKISHPFSGKGRSILGIYFLSELAVTVTFKFQIQYRVFHNECPNFKTLYFCNHEPQMNETCAK